MGWAGVLWGHLSFSFYVCAHLPVVPRPAGLSVLICQLSPTPTGLSLPLVFVRYKQ